MPVSNAAEALPLRVRLVLQGQPRPLPASQARHGWQDAEEYAPGEAKHPEAGEVCQSLLRDVSRLASQRPFDFLAHTPQFIRGSRRKDEAQIDAAIAWAVPIRAALLLRQRAALAVA